MKTIFNGKHFSKHQFICILILNISAITIPVQSGEINGLVWLDDNGNGLQDANESLFAQTVPDFGAPNIALYPQGSIELIDWIPLDEGSEGQFRFANVADGVYYLCVSNEFLELGLSVTRPNAGNDSIDSDFDFSPCSYDIRVSNGQLITRDLGLTGGSDTPLNPADPVIPDNPAPTDPMSGNTVSGIVWLDSNENGLQDADEDLFAQTVPDFGAPNIALYPQGSIELIDLIFLDEASKGQFLFENIDDGVYYICVSNEFLELGLNVTVPNAGDDSIDSDFDFSPCSYDIRVSNGQLVIRDLGLTGGSDTPVDPADPVTPTDPVNPSEPPYPISGNTIGGFVWLDSNGNGLQDNNESGFGQIIPGFGTPPIVELYDAEYAVVELIALDENRNGHYTFTNLADGIYHLCISQIYRNIGLFISPANVGNDDTIDNDFSSTSCVSENIIVSGQQTKNYDMGLSGDGTLSGGTISGRIWIDNNNNRIIDNNEGIRTVVSIQPGSFDRDVEAIGMFQRHVASNSNGDYEFTDLPTGTYEVNCESCRFGQIIRVTSPDSNVTRDLRTELGHLNIGNRNIIEVDGTNCTLQEALDAANLVKQVGGCVSNDPNHALIVLESNSIHPAVDHARFPLQRPTPADLPGISKPTVKIYGNGATIESFTTKADNLTEQRVGFAEIFNAKLGFVTNSGSFVILRHVTVDGGVSGFGTPDGGVTPNLFSTLGSASGNGVFLQDSQVLGDASLVNFIIRTVVNGSLSLVNRAGFSDSGTVKNSTVNHLKFNDQIITINDSLIGGLFIKNFEGSSDDLPNFCFNTDGIVNSNCLLN